MGNGATVFNYVRQSASAEFRDLVPEASANNIADLRGILFADEHTNLLNEFVFGLINRVGKTIITKKSFTNPLAILKKGSQLLGTDIQEIYENPAESEPYQYNNEGMAQLLKITDPDTHEAFYRLNRRDKYTKTIQRVGLQNAFVSWEAFEKYLTNITNSLYSGNYIDEYKYTKMLVDGAYEQNKIVQEVVSNVTTEANAKKFVKKCRELYVNFKSPSKDYNAYNMLNASAIENEKKKAVTTWTDDDRVVLILSSKVSSEIDVEVLAKAFNIESSKLLGRIIVIDNFQNEEILGLLCDEAFFQIYDNIFRFEEFYNASTMAYNEYLHAWGTYAISPFANAVALVTEKSSGTDISG